MTQIEVLHPQPEIILPEITPFAIDEARYLIENEQPLQKRRSDGEYLEMNRTKNWRLIDILMNAPVANKDEFRLGGAVGFRTLRRFYQVRSEPVPILENEQAFELNMQLGLTASDIRGHCIDFLIRMSRDEKYKIYMDILRKTTDDLCEYAKTTEELVDYSCGFTTTLDAFSK